MKRILSSILVIALVLTMFPVALAAGNSSLNMGNAEYSVALGDVVNVPVYLTGADAADLKVEMIQFKIPVVAGLKAAVTDGAISSDYVAVKSKSINVFYDGAKFTSTASAPLFTINYTAEAEGTYDLSFNTIEIYVPGQADPIELDVVGTTVKVTNGAITPEPPAAVKSGLYFGEDSYDAKLGDAVNVPVYLTGAEGADLKVEMIQFKIPVVAGLKAAVTDGAISSDYVAVKSKSINVFYDGAKFTSTASAPLFTINYTAEAAGTYELSFNTIEIYVPGEADPIELNVGTTTVVVTAGQEPPAPVVTLESIAVDPAAFEVPYGTEDVAAAVKAAITKVIATYSDATTKEVTDYTVAIDGSKAIVTYEGKTAEIALTYEPAPVVLTGITVAPAAFEVPYGADARAAVEDAITAVTAVYSDGTTVAVTGYEVTVDGDVATVTYEGKTATIALTYEAAPVEPPVATNSGLYFGEASYEAKLGDAVNVPVYLTGAEGADLKVEMIQFKIPVVAGLKAAVTDGAISSDYVAVKSKSINVFYDGTKFTSTASAPLFTINYTAEAAGTYELSFNTIEIYVPGEADPIELNVGKTTVVVTAGEEPPAPVVTLESITVNPTAVEVPYGVDAKVAVEDAITGVTALYSDGTTAPVTGYEVTVDGDVATVTYEGKTATIALTFAKPPVTDVEIIVAVNTIVVPYNITVPVDVYAISQVGEVKVKDSEGAERVVEAQITYDAAESVVVVAYADLTPVKIPVTVITLVDYTIGGITGVIEIPYDCADAAEYVKGIISVTANLSDGSTMDIPYFTVEVNDNWTAANVFVNGDQIEVVDTKKGEAPVAAITGIKVEVAEAIVVPYGTDDIAAYIKSKIVVKTVDEDGVENAISEYTVDAKDGYADIAFGEFTESVDFTVETAQLVANVATIEIPYTVAEADYAAYIAQNVALTIDYSANTADKAVVATAEDVVIDVDVAVITIEGLVVNVPFTVQAAPEYFAEAVPAYGLEGKVLVKITGVADGKVAVVNGLQATYFGNGNFAVVVDEAYTVELVEVAAMPAVAEFGKLHPAGVTAWDALVTNDEALEKDVEVFEDIQMYVLADLDGNGKIEAIDALNINKISLFQGAVNVPTWVDAE